MAVRIIPFPVASGEINSSKNFTASTAQPSHPVDLLTVFYSNLSFHQTLFGLCGNSCLIETIDQLARKVHGIRFYANASPESLDRARLDHLKMIKALRGGRRDELISLTERISGPRRRPTSRHIESGSVGATRRGQAAQQSLLRRALASRGRRLRRTFSHIHPHSAAAPSPLLSPHAPSRGRRAPNPARSSRRPAARAAWRALRLGRHRARSAVREPDRRLSLKATAIFFTARSVRPSSATALTNGQPRKSLPQNAAPANRRCRESVRPAACRTGAPARSGAPDRPRSARPSTGSGCRACAWRCRSRPRWCRRRWRECLADRTACRRFEDPLFHRLWGGRGSHAAGQVLLSFTWLDSAAPL